MMIRNFIYLDSEKLRSISSQLFEGVTERVVSTNINSDQQQESQKGDFGSGRILADIFSEERSSSELKFLEDHAYTLFEKKLIDDQMLECVDDSSDIIEMKRNFIKATANLSFNDLVFSAKMLKDFNDIGEAFWRITNQPMQMTSQSEKMLTDNEVRRRAAEQGLQMHKKVSDAASLIIDFGFKGLLEANMNIGKSLLSAPLKREFLRENESMLIHKYSRVTRIKFSIIGFITQHHAQKTIDINSIPDVKDASDVKNAMRTLNLHMRTFEEVFISPSDNEIVLDPIAIYSEL